MNFNALSSKIDEILKEKGRISIAIDGDCCSGKTTLAEKLSKKYGCDVVHTDDFFLPFSLRTKERYAEPGGNIHYERFILEVLPHLKSADEFSYGVFDCSVGEITGKKKISAGNIRIVEGSYSLHPKFEGAYDLKLFLSISSEVQQERILLRDGSEALFAFIEKWIPFEKRYHSFYAIEDKADIVIKENCE